MTENKKSKSSVKKQKESQDPVIKRLDALIRLFIELNKPKTKEEFTEGTSARLLKSLDFSPTEIAKLLGKKSRTDISAYLYDKPKERKSKKRNHAKKPISQPPNTAATTLKEGM